MSRERIVFGGAVAVIALHVLDDSFLQPEDGTSAADHLVSGLVPLAALGLATAGFLVARAGARAAIALIVGMFGIVAGLEGWHYTLAVGASGDDFTGLVTLPAGIVLLILGAVILWRSRRSDGSRARRYLRRGLIGAGALILTVTVIAPFMSAYGYTHLGRAVVPDPDLGGADYKDVKFETADGLELEGWYIPSRNGAAVIASGRSGPRDRAAFLARNGYGVLLFDRRGEGASEGDPNSLGWEGVRDIEAAIAFVEQQPDVDPERIGGIGLSVGGEMMIEAAAESEALKAVVSEGAGIRSVREAAELGADQVPTWAAITLGTAVFSGAGPPENLKDLVGRVAPRAVLLIYAEEGQGGEELSAEYFDAAGEPKEVWKAAGGHTGGYDADPAEYERLVVGFFDEALARPASAPPG